MRVPDAFSVFESLRETVIVDNSKDIPWHWSWQYYYNVSYKQSDVINGVFIKELEVTKINTRQSPHQTKSESQRELQSVSWRFSLINSRYLNTLGN